MALTDDRYHRFRPRLALVHVPPWRPRESGKGDQETRGVGRSRPNARDSGGDDPYDWYVCSQLREKPSELLLEFEKEQANNRGTGTWFELFKAVDLRRTEITCLAWGCQNLCGSGFVAGTSYILQQAGISQEVSYRFGLGSSVITVAANSVSFWMMNRYGRRTIYVVGMTVLMTGLIIIGSTAVAVDHHANGAMWAQACIQIVSD